jgi:glycosyltransferase involved in cell wall biosynthesis
MTRPVAAFVSYRLGGTDGVSVEARKWEWALGELGFATRRIAGELEGFRPDDVWLPFLAIDPVAGATPQPDALDAAIAGADLVVVANLCSLPLNLAAARLAANVLADHEGRVLFHHHDLAWERARFADVDELPPDRPNSLHVTINDRARRALAARGITAHTVRNAFDLDPEPGDREATRTSFGFGTDELVVLQPTRAIPRKNIGAGLRLAEALAARPGGRPVRYWLTGPAEDGYQHELDRLLAGARVPVAVGRADRPADAYAAADLVVFPSTWEGFGNPVIETVAARRLLAVGHYPVLDEIVEATGIELLSVDDPDSVAAAVRAPDPAGFDRNLERVRADFSLSGLPDRLRAAFSAVRWDRW